jgi:hypothetical protein
VIRDNIIIIVIIIIAVAETYSWKGTWHSIILYCPIIPKAVCFQICVYPLSVEWTVFDNIKLGSTNITKQLVTTHIWCNSIRSELLMLNAFKCFNVEHFHERILRQSKLLTKQTFILMQVLRTDSFCIETARCCDLILIYLLKPCGLKIILVPPTHSGKRKTKPFSWLPSNSVLLSQSLRYLPSFSDGACVSHPTPPNPWYSKRPSFTG